ncbi:uncharacterized protein LOC123540843 [Mercenaria mercenaria]|uniref:uncharacterized protein LOC123540843 n=1 Tax=Mercenaria mercenaria TaxID=6596 RepID=UPI00234F5624|nr:uncharacterized protein LOC123540843 [Mercenaria mercenaria]
MLKAFAKLALFFVVTAIVCIVVGLATPEWLSKPGHYQGLWDYCFYLTHTGGKKTCMKLEKRSDFEGWIQAVRALVILSVVTSLFDLILLIFYMKRDDGRTNLNRIRAAIVVCILSGALCFSAVIVYAVQKHNGHFNKGYNFSWSFILTSIGGGVISLVPIVLLLEIRKSRILGSYESI